MDFTGAVSVLMDTVSFYGNRSLQHSNKTTYLAPGGGEFMSEKLFIEDLELKDRDYKGIPIIPFVDPKRIKDTFNQLIKSYLPQTPPFFRG